MNDKKFCFIICSNCDYRLNECLFYLQHLIVPEGFEQEILTVHDASSMTAGYQEAMESSDAKYKIYMHQDVFILNKHFLEDILSIFRSDSAVGMIGMAGPAVMSYLGIMWLGGLKGTLYLKKTVWTNYKTYRYDLKTDGYSETEALDGLCLATQADIPWRTDLFDGWDLYDASQCMEFRRAGYKLVVPAQRNPWCLHDDGRILSLWNYDKYRRRYLQEYGPDMRVNREQAFWGRRRVDEHKIAFVIAAGDEAYTKECLRYLEQLRVPDGFTKETVCVRGFDGMARAYNEGVRRTDAKYKVYLTEDTFVMNKDLLHDLLKVFDKNEDIGLIGVLGSACLETEGRFQLKSGLGLAAVCGGDGEIALSDLKVNPMEEYLEVETLDGMLLMTNRDVPWRADLFDGWELWDVSQSYEFRRRGYKVVVPRQETVWALNDGGARRAEEPADYERHRRILVDEYLEFSSRNMIKKNARSASKDGTGELVRGPGDSYEALHLAEINRLERKAGRHPYLCELVSGCDALLQAYTEVKFLVRRLENNIKDAEQELQEFIRQKGYSIFVFRVAAVHNCLNPDWVLQLLERCFKSADST